MKRIKYHANYGFSGTDTEDVIEFDDDATEEEIEEAISTTVLEKVEL